MQYNSRYTRSPKYNRYAGKNTHGSGGNVKSNIPLAALLALDLIGVAVVMGIFCLFYFMIPRAIDTAPISLAGDGSSLQASDNPASTSQPDGSNAQDGGTAVPDNTSGAGASGDTSVTNPPSDGNAEGQGTWGAKFTDKFAAGTIETTDNSYKSKDISVTIEKNQNNGITWYVADIYLRNIDNFKTALAKDQFGKGITEATLDMADRVNAIVSISGDYYGNHETGIVVRNGKLYRKTQLNDVMIMNNDGSMQTFDNNTFNPNDVVKNGAWQAWSFGPMLLDNGQPMTKFNSNLNPLNPRAAIGYYEPGHYCLVIVDGRQPGYSDGISLKDFSQLFADMGCKAAYNLDGGQTAVMTFMGKWVNQPYKDGRNCSDIVYIGEKTN